MVDFGGKRTESDVVLDRLHIVDFKGIHDLVVSPGRLTVFIGANGVGKTSILEAVSLASLLIGDLLEEVGRVSKDAMFFRVEELPKSGLIHLTGRWERRQLVHHGATALEIELAIASQVTVVEIPAAENKPPRIYIRRSDDKRHLGIPTERERDALRPMTRVSRLRLDPERIAAPAALRAPPILEPDGSGLPAFLQYLQGRRDGTFEKIEAAMREIVPIFRQVRFEPTSWTSQETELLTVEGQRVPRVVSREHNGVNLLVEFNDGAVVPAAHVSEGTLLALAILSAVYGHQAQQQRLLLIDDLERGLHPSAQQRLITSLKAILAAVPDLQILATTHSPDLVDACEPGDVQVLGRGPAGVTARSLTEHPEAAKWLKLLRVGEFWSTVGEDWVAESPEPQA